MARNASIVAIAFLLSRILGFAREVLIANQFGTEGEASAYVAAFRVPDLLFLVIMAGSFGSAFIPVFAGFLGRNEHGKASDLANAVLTWALVATLAAAGLMFLLAEPIIRYLVAPDLSEEYISLASNLMRLLLLSPILLGLGIAAKGILEAQDQFLLPALAPLVYNLGIIGGALFLAPSMGIEGLALGVVVGALGHVAIQAPGLLRAGIRFRPNFSRHVEGLSEVWRLLVPRVIGQAAFQANFIIVTAFASQVNDGGPSAVNYAWQLLMLPHGILALSISTVIFPTMSRQFDGGDVEGLRKTFGHALRPLVYLSAPAAIGLFAFREPIVRIIYQSGEFDDRSTELVVAPLAYLALSLVAYGLVEVLTRAFYAMRDARTPVIASIAVIAVNVLVCWLTIDRLGLGGLGLGLALSTTIEGIILGVVLVRRLTTAGMTFGRGWATWLVRVGFATLAMTAVVVLLGPPLGALTREVELPYYVRFAGVGFAIALAAATYGFASMIVGLPEAAMITSAVGRRIEPIIARRFPRLAAMLPQRRTLRFTIGQARAAVPAVIADEDGMVPTTGSTYAGWADAPQPDASAGLPDFDDLPARRKTATRRRRAPAAPEAPWDSEWTERDPLTARPERRPDGRPERRSLSRPGKDRSWLDRDPWSPLPEAKRERVAARPTPQPSRRQPPPAPSSPPERPAWLGNPPRRERRRPPRDRQDD